MNGFLNVFCLAMVIAEALGLFDSQKYLWPQNQQRLVVNILFLNNIHVAFTYLLITCHPVFKYRFTSLRRNFKWFIPVGILIGGLNFAILASREYFAFGMSLAKFMGLTLPTFHLLAQFRGLSINLLDRTGRTTSSLLWRIAIPLFIVSKILMEFILEQKELRGVLVCFNFAVFFALWTVSTRSLVRQGESGPYTLFNLRLFLFPFALVSDLATLFTAALHGLEYGSLVLSQISRPMLKGKTLQLGVFAGLMLVVGGLSWLLDATAPSLYEPLVVPPLITLVVLHYYMDSVLFRHSSFYEVEATAKAS